MTLWSEVSYRLRLLPILHSASSSFPLLFLPSVFYSFCPSSVSSDLVLLPTIDPRVFLLPLPVLYKITLVTTVSARQGGLIRPLGVLTSLGRTNRFNSLPSRYTPLELPALQTIPVRHDSAAAKSLSFYAPLLLFFALLPSSSSFSFLFLFYTFSFSFISLYRVISYIFSSTFWDFRTLISHFRQVLLLTLF